MAFVMEIALNVNKRNIEDKAGSLRKSGMVPGVLYGTGKENVIFQVSLKDLKKVYEEAGESTLVALSVDKAKPEYVLISDMDLDPVTDTPIHVDLLRVKMDELTEAEVELEFVGVSKAVKDDKGVLIKNLDTVEVKALPIDLPKSIVVDISTLNTFEDVITIGDLKVSAKVEILASKEDVVATVTPPRSDEELAALDETATEDVSSIEVEEKGKKEEDEEGAEGEEGATPKKEGAPEAKKEETKK